MNKYMYVAIFSDLCSIYFFACVNKILEFLLQQNVLHIVPTYLKSNPDVCDMKSIEQQIHKNSPNNTEKYTYCGFRSLLLYVITIC